jgi:hypothetical protein
LEVISIRDLVVPANFENLRDKPSPKPAVDLNDHVQRICDIALDGGIRNFDATLQHAGGESRYPLSCGVGVNGRYRPTVTRIEELQQVERLFSTNFTESQGGQD